MGSTFYCNNRFHPYASEIKSRQPNTETTTEHRKPENPPSNIPSQQNTDTKSTKDSSQVLQIGKYLIFARNIWNSSLHHAVDVETRKEYSCRVTGINKYREFVTPYFEIEEHENVNRIVEVLLGEDQAYVFFEPSFGDLHSHVRAKRRLKEVECCKLFKQIVEIVAHCHENGVILRDLKLRKFCFQNKERTRLKLETLDDAYISHTHEDVLTDKHGCPAYVSPEILESTNGYSGRAADIWSLGVMLYTMLFGRYPFHDNEPSALFSKIRSGHFVLPDCISSKAKCLLRSILRREPSERLSAQEILEHPWFRSPVTSTTSSRFERRYVDQCVPDLEDNKITS